MEICLHKPGPATRRSPPTERLLESEIDAHQYFAAAIEPWVTLNRKLNRMTLNTAKADQRTDPLATAEQQRADRHEQGSFAGVVQAVEQDLNTALKKLNPA